MTDAALGSEAQMQKSIIKAFARFEAEDGTVSQEEFMNVAPQLFPSWRRHDRWAMLKASQALADGRVDYKAFAEFLFAVPGKGGRVPGSPRCSAVVPAAKGSSAVSSPKGSAAIPMSPKKSPQSRHAGAPPPCKLTGVDISRAASMPGRLPAPAQKIVDEFKAGTLVSSASSRRALPGTDRHSHTGRTPSHRDVGSRTHGSSSGSRSARTKAVNVKARPTSPGHPTARHVSPNTSRARLTSPSHPLTRTPKGRVSTTSLDDRSAQRNDSPPLPQAVVDLGTFCAEQEPPETTINLKDMQTGNDKYPLDAIAIIDLQDISPANTASAEPDSQNAVEPEPEERILRTPRSKPVADPVDRLRGKVSDLKLKVDLSSPSARYRQMTSEGIANRKPDGNRIAEAQARTSACIEQFRSFAEIVQTLESENIRLRTANEQLEKQVRDLREGFQHDNLARQVRALTSVGSPRTDVVLTRRSLGVRRPSPGKSK